MIKTTVEYICDRCKTDVGEGGEIFKVKRDKVDTNRIEHATNYQISGDGVMLFGGYHDKYNAFHLCTQCVIEVEGFINNAP